jgi:peptidoglycan-associated lipoprotein
MFTQLNKISTRAILLLSVAALSACASKVRLDDLPAVVDRSNSGGIYSSTDSTTRGGINDASSNGLDGLNGNNGTNGTNGMGTTTGGNVIRTVQAGGTGNAGNAGGANSAADMAGLLAKRSVYFDYDSYEIRDEFKAVLQAHAKNLGTKRAVKVALEGHTDERGGAEYNLALGQKRANAVLQTLQTLGVAATQMEAVSFGKEKPKASGASEAGFAENRRVDIQYQ